MYKRQHPGRGKKGQESGLSDTSLALCVQEAPESQITEEEKLLGETAGGQDIDDSMQAFGDTDQVSSGSGWKCGLLLLPSCASR